MPGREEALERARASRRLGELRQRLNTDRADNTLLRDLSNSIPMPSPPHLRGREDKREGDEAASSALAGFATAMGTTAAGIAAGNWGPDEAAKRSPIYKDYLKESFQELLPKVSPGFYEPDLYESDIKIEKSGGFRGGDNLQDEKLYSKLPKKANWFSDVYGLSEGELHQAEVEASAHAAGRDPRKPAKEDYEYARQSLQRMGDELPITGVDWEGAPSRLGQKTPPYLVTAVGVPEFGPDLGGFSRGSTPAEGVNTTKAYTVVPNSNAGRFRSRLLPSLIDRVYGEKANQVDSTGSAGWDRISLSDGLERSKPISPVAKSRWNTLSKDEQLGMLQREAPGRPGTYPAGYVWGTLYDTPRYEYASVGGKNAPNPEVVVSEVRTPPELETHYMPTGDTFDPRVVYKQRPGEKAIGPAWGASDYLGAPAASRPKRNTAGDLVWRSDLTERRGGLSLADAQAVQQHLGLPVSVRRGTELSEQVLERAVEGIRRSDETLGSHADVIDRYARSLPRAGNTTAPRQPAKGLQSNMEMDTAVGIPSGVRERFDLHRGMQAAGFSPTRPGVQQLNKTAQNNALRRVSSFNAIRNNAPGIGAGLALADPSAAAILGAAVSERDPRVRLGLARDAVRIYGENAVVGGVTGAAVSGALSGAVRLGLPGLASGAAGVIGVTAPALAIQAVTDSADKYLLGATGRGLSSHYQDFRDKGSGMSQSMIERDRSRPQPRSNGGVARQVLPQLLPQPRAVMANTPTGVARVVPTPRRNAVEQEARNRVNLFRQRFNPLKGEFGLSELLRGR